MRRLGNFARMAVSLGAVPAALVLLLLALVQAAVLPASAADAAQAPGATTVTVVVDGGGRVMASSQPARYPVGSPLQALTPIPPGSLVEALGGATPVGGEARHGGELVRWSIEPLATTGAGAGATAVYVESALPTGHGGAAERLPVPAGLDILAVVLLAVATALGIRRAHVLGARTARLQERRRVARELHDSISQDLAGIRLELAALARQRGHGPELRKRLASLDATGGEAIRHLRRLLLELHPPASEGLDLETALRDLALSYGSRLGIAIDARVQPVCLVPQASEALVHVAREALANVARHAGAGRVTMTLSAAGGRAELAVADDGRGCDPDQMRRGLGLRLARERVREVGGDLDLLAGAGRGVRVRATVPLATP